jgi:predicted DNA-binding transcriptional regulator AlpA
VPTALIHRRRIGSSTFARGIGEQGCAAPSASWLLALCSHFALPEVGSDYQHEQVRYSRAEPEQQMRAGSTSSQGLRHMTHRRSSTLPPGVPPRGLCRAQSAEYVGVSATKFDQMVCDGRMPKPKRIDGRVVWDRLQLDSAFAALPDVNGRGAIWDQAVP